MGESNRFAEVRVETTEQALARLEAECGWSDAPARFPELFAPGAETNPSDADTSGA